MRSGAYDYITKPFPKDLLLATVRRCLESHNLKREVSKMQAELLKQERLVTIGSMGGAIAHRMRNPLNIIQMCAQYLETRVGGDEENYQVLQAIQEKVKTLEALTRDFVEYSRASRIRKAPEQIDRLINDVITNVAPRCKIQEVIILRDFEPNLPQVDVDADLIREVFTNIIDNALEAMKGSGRIWVTTQLARTAPFLHVAIVNTGSVLPDEISERIFEPFFTTKETGMGLGLAIVRQVVEAHGGVIQAIGDPKKKTTTFHVHLPLQKSGEAK
jgi:two-component system NtrC family sensor kinase